MSQTLDVARLTHLAGVLKARLAKPSWVAVGLAVVLCAPVVVALAALLGEPWYASGDHGLIWLRATDVGGSETPLVGPYSRAGWNHPGPLLFYVMALPLRVLGGDPRALLLGAAAVNVVSLIGVAWLLARRRDLTSAVVVAATVAVLVATMGGALLADPWNPYVAILPFLAAIVGSWAVATGGTWPLVAVVGAASLAMQSHTGYGPAVAATVGIGIAGWIWHAWRGPGLMTAVRGAAWPLGVSALVGLVAWAAPVWDQFFGSGNLATLASGGAGSTRAPGERLGLVDALGVAALELRPMGPWASGTEGVQMFTGNVDPASALELIVPVAAMAATLAVFVARRCWSRLWLAGLVIGVASVGVVSTALITGTVHPYLIRWWWPIAALWWAVVALGAVELVRPWLPRRLGAVALGLVASFAVVVLALAAVRAPDAEPPAARYQPGEAALTGPALAAVDPDVPVTSQRVGASWGGEAVGLMVSLEREGVPTAAPDDRGWQFGNHRAERVAGQQLLVVAAGATVGVEEMASERGGEVIARWDPLGEDEREEANALWERLAVAFEDSGDNERAHSARQHSTWTLFLAPESVSRDDVLRLDELAGRGVPLALVYLPPTDADLP